ncbi:MFS transporter [Pseudorhodoplanes sp.]|uniref:MFS transporter n=1 Tax=Pseudorhodoplanes sp. TaxID=1934341 RepID=UPI002C004E0E|nr:MFS transporter [Pseudorhodoplanes sp.]HWV41436.1 MFS transporter [Pseudorhodoplanes sp.]
MTNPVTASPSRAIFLLSLAGFASQAMVRVSDSLLPQIAADLAVTVGAASIVVTAYGLAHGTVQLFGGEIGDRLGKYYAVAMLSAIAAVATMLCGIATSLGSLVFYRLLCGLAAGCVIPLAMAFIGDVVPYDQRQPVLGRYLTGQISGLLFGQVAGGVLGDLFGWRNVFFILGGIFALAAAALVAELVFNPATRASSARAHRKGGLIAEYRIVLSSRWARFLTISVFFEAALLYAVLSFIGADLHLRFDLSFTMVGVVVGFFAAGGLIYTFSVKRLVNRLGQIGLVMTGGSLVSAGFLILSFQPVWWFAPLATTLIGLGFYMVHNTLQTNATQMAPQARATALAIFSSALYMGITAGVALAALIVDRYGAVPIFLISAVGFPLLCVIFARGLARRRQAAAQTD